MHCITLLYNVWIISICSRFQFLNVTSSNSFRDHFHYSNLMYVLAGCLIEILGNDSYETLLTERILRPLGMNSTRLVQKDDIRQFNDLAQIYYIDRIDDQLYPLSVETLRYASSILLCMYLRSCPWKLKEKSQEEQQFSQVPAGSLGSLELHIFTFYSLYSGKLVDGKSVEFLEILSAEIRIGKTCRLSNIET